MINFKFRNDTDTKPIVTKGNKYGKANRLHSENGSNNYAETTDCIGFDFGYICPKCVFHKCDFVNQNVETMSEKYGNEIGDCKVEIYELHKGKLKGIGQCSCYAEKHQWGTP